MAVIVALNVLDARGEVWCEFGMWYGENPIFGFGVVSWHLGIFVNSKCVSNAPAFYTQRGAVAKTG